MARVCCTLMLQTKEHTVLHRSNPRTDIVAHSFDVEVVKAGLGGSIGIVFSAQSSTGGRVRLAGPLCSGSAAG